MKECVKTIKIQKHMDQTQPLFNKCLEKILHLSVNFARISNVSLDQRYVSPICRIHKNVYLYSKQQKKKIQEGVGVSKSAYCIVIRFLRVVHYIFLDRSLVLRDLKWDPFLGTFLCFGFHFRAFLWLFYDLRTLGKLTWVQKGQGAGGKSVSNPNVCRGKYNEPLREKHCSTNNICRFLNKSDYIMYLYKMVNAKLCNVKLCMLMNNY